MLSADRATQNLRAVSSIVRGRLDRSPEWAIAEDEDAVHVVVPSICWRGRLVSEDQDTKKPRSPSWCRGPWSLRSLEAPVRRVGRAV